MVSYAPGFAKNLGRIASTGAKLRAWSEGDIDPSTNTAPVTTRDYTITCIMVGYMLREIDGARVLAGDRKAIIAAYGLAQAPRPGDQIIYKGQTWQVIACRRPELKDEPIVYIAQVRL